MQPLKRTHSPAFSLLELMTVLAIIGVLYALVAPQYRQFILRTNRTEGQALLVDAAARQARHHAQTQVFITAERDIGELQLPHTSGDEVRSATGLYRLRVGPGDGGYLLQAEPLGQQRGDNACATLLLSGTGHTGNTGPAPSRECWK